MKPEERKKLARELLLFWFLYCGVALGLDGVIFLLSHIPPEAISFDPVILKLGVVARFFVLPKMFLRGLWPAETTPWVFNYLLPLGNALLWAAAMTGLKRLWNFIRR